MSLRNAADGSRSSSRWSCSRQTEKPAELKPAPLPSIQAVPIVIALALADFVHSAAAASCTALHGRLMMSSRRFDSIHNGRIVGAGRHSSLCECSGEMNGASLLPHAPSSHLLHLSSRPFGADSGAAPCRRRSKRAMNGGFAGLTACACGAVPPFDVGRRQPSLKHTGAAPSDIQTGRTNSAPHRACVSACDRRSASHCERAPPPPCWPLIASVCLLCSTAPPAAHSLAPSQQPSAANPIASGHLTAAPESRPALCIASRTPRRHVAHATVSPASATGSYSPWLSTACPNLERTGNNRCATCR